MADPTTNDRTEGYFYNLKKNGLAFDKEKSAKYEPMSKEEFCFTLLDIEGKTKENKLMQIADTYVYSIARGSYERKYDVYRRLAESGKLITSQVEGKMASTLGIKTYCFELVKAKNDKGRV